MPGRVFLKRHVCRGSGKGILEDDADVFRTFVVFQMCDVLPIYENLAESGTTVPAIAFSSVVFLLRFRR